MRKVVVIWLPKGATALTLMSKGLAPQVMEVRVCWEESKEMSTVRESPVFMAGRVAAPRLWLVVIALESAFPEAQSEMLLLLGKR